MRLLALDDQERVREAAFGLIVVRQRPADLDAVAEASGITDLAPILEALTEAGWVDRGIDGSVTGSAGLTLADSPHGLRMWAGEFKTWCAYDALGIPASLEADATVATTCGQCGGEITVDIVSGVPDRAGPETLWLAAGDGDLRTSFCTPTVILCGPEHGEAWADRQGGAGELVDLATAASRGAIEWAASATAARRIAASDSTDVEYVGGPMDGTHETLRATPSVISTGDGEYRRSVRCADDGALRYVWHNVEGAPPLVDVLLEATPKGIDLDEVRAHILRAEGVGDIHDLHAWTITSGMNVLSAHVVLDPGADPPAVLDELCRCLSGDFDIEHSTFQLESSDRTRLEEARHT